MTQISIIVAIAKNYAIGKNNDLLWHIPEDLKRFKKITSGCPVIMGKRTYYSLPKRPLPNRENIVITDIKDEVIEGCTMAYSIDDAVNKMDPEKENFIIGGASIYNQFMPIANKLYITWVHKDFDADTFYPDIDFNSWMETERTDMPVNETLGFSYSYITYIRK